jgi:predicted HicB family RNase H-like nuclease
MTNTMTHKGYTARIEYDPRDEIFVGRVLGIEDRITFHGATVGTLRRDFRAAIDHYLVDCAARTRAPQKPYSGEDFTPRGPRGPCSRRADRRGTGKEPQPVGGGGAGSRELIAAQIHLGSRHGPERTFLRRPGLQGPLHSR